MTVLQFAFKVHKLFPNIFNNNSVSKDLRVERCQHKKIQENNNTNLRELSQTQERFAPKFKRNQEKIFFKSRLPFFLFFEVVFTFFFFFFFEVVFLFLFEVVFFLFIFYVVFHFLFFLRSSYIFFLEVVFHFSFFLRSSSI